MAATCARQTTPCRHIPTPREIHQTLDKSRFIFRLSAFTKALVDLGWTDGRNVRMVLRWVGGAIDPVRALTQELVGLRPDIILTEGTPATAAAQGETRTIPIVFANVGDPVASGLVIKLNQPGGNITGFALYEPALGSKWLQLLRKSLPT
jgi:putative ABC transport system substrate-binding protein